MRWVGLTDSWAAGGVFFLRGGGEKACENKMGDWRRRTPRPSQLLSLRVVTALSFLSLPLSPSSPIAFFYQVLPCVRRRAHRVVGVEQLGREVDARARRGARHLGERKGGRCRGRRPAERGGRGLSRGGLGCSRGRRGPSLLLFFLPRCCRRHGRRRRGEEAEGCCPADSEKRGRVWRLPPSHCRRHSQHRDSRRRSSSALGQEPL